MSEEKREGLIYRLARPFFGAAQDLRMNDEDRKGYCGVRNYFGERALAPVILRRDQDDYADIPKR